MPCTYEANVMIADENVHGLDCQYESTVHSEIDLSECIYTNCFKMNPSKDRAVPMVARAHFSVR
jgi:hypothetical protein